MGRRESVQTPALELSPTLQQHQQQQQPHLLPPQLLQPPPPLLQLQLLPPPPPQQQQQQQLQSTPTQPSQESVRQCLDQHLASHVSSPSPSRESPTLAAQTGCTGERTRASTGAAPGPLIMGSTWTE